MRFDVMDGRFDALEARLGVMSHDDRLVFGPAISPLHTAAVKGSPGRKAETLEIATYANDLRLQKKTWKKVLSACKKQWPDDRRVRNVRQIRATWHRHFASGQNRH